MNELLTKDRRQRVVLNPTGTVRLCYVYHAAQEWYSMKYMYEVRSMNDRTLPVLVPGMIQGYKYNWRQIVFVHGYSTSSAVMPRSTVQ